MIEDRLLIKSRCYEIPAVLALPERNGRFPVVILCHGTGSCKDEVGQMFVKLAEALANRQIASLRFDFAGAGDSRADPRLLTFNGEVADVETVYAYLSKHPHIDPKRMAILGFSQGARVMASFLEKHPADFFAAVSWSGACQNGIGVFKEWFEKYYDQAVKTGFAAIPLPWRDEMIFSKTWFDEIDSSSPLDGLSWYTGPLLAVAGTKDALVPYTHAYEIAKVCRDKNSRVKIIEGADHIFNVFDPDKNFVSELIQSTADWIAGCLLKSQA